MRICLTGIAAGNAANARNHVGDLDRGLVILLPGVEGRGWQLGGVLAGLRDAGLRQELEVIPWGSYPFNSLDNLRNIKRNRGRARVVAHKIAAYQADHPNRPLTLVGYSGGGGLALLTLNNLPPHVRIDRAVLIAAAISPRFDLSYALTRCRDGLISFYSPDDWFMIGLCTRLLGTIDRVHTSSAGRTGFRDERGELKQAPGLTQILYNPAWIELGHDGGHFGSLARPWARQVLAPHVVGERGKGFPRGEVREGILAPAADPPNWTP